MASLTQTARVAAAALPLAFGALPGASFGGQQPAAATPTATAGAQPATALPFVMEAIGKGGLAELGSRPLSMLDPADQKFIAEQIPSTKGRSGEVAPGIFSKVFARNDVQGASQVLFLNNTGDVVKSWSLPEELSQRLMANGARYVVQAIDAPNGKFALLQRGSDLTVGEVTFFTIDQTGLDRSNGKLNLHDPNGTMRKRLAEAVTTIADSRQVSGTTAPKNVVAGQPVTPASPAPVPHQTYFPASPRNVQGGEVQTVKIFATTAELPTVDQKIKDLSATVTAAKISTLFLPDKHGKPIDSCRTADGCGAICLSNTSPTELKHVTVRMYLQDADGKLELVRPPRIDDRLPGETRWHKSDQRQVDAVDGKGAACWSGIIPAGKSIEVRMRVGQATKLQAGKDGQRVVFVVEDDKSPATARTFTPASSGALTIEDKEIEGGWSRKLGIFGL